MDERSSLLYLIDFVATFLDADEVDDLVMRDARLRVMIGSPISEVLTETAAEALFRLAPERFSQLAARHGWPIAQTMHR